MYVCVCLCVSGRRQDIRRDRWACVGRCTCLVEVPRCVNERTDKYIDNHDCTARLHHCRTSNYSTVVCEHVFVRQNPVMCRKQALQYCNNGTHTNRSNFNILVSLFVCRSGNNCFIGGMRLVIVFMRTQQTSAYNSSVGTSTVDRLPWLATPSSGHRNNKYTTSIYVFNLRVSNERGGRHAGIYYIRSFQEIFKHGDSNFTPFSGIKRLYYTVLYCSL